MMTRHRKKLVVIEAIRYTGDNLRGVLEKIASTGRCEFADARAALHNTEASHE